MKKNMKGFLKCLIAVLLVIVMTVGIVPISAIECTHPTTSQTRDGNDMVVSCLDCGAELSRTPIEPDHTHEYGTGAVTKVATCTEAGTMQYNCTVCGEPKIEEIPATGHKWEFLIHVDASCTEPGYDLYQCEYCYAEDKRVTEEATGHKYEETQTTLPDGSVLKINKCSICGAVADSERTNTHVHSYEAEITKAPTCTEPGIKTFTCTDPECDGSDNATYTEEIPAKGHNYIWVEESTATCTEAGHKYQKCTRCNGIGEEETTPALGHDWDENGFMVVTKDPDCYNTGIALAKCKRCGAKEERVVPKTSHEFYELKRVESTCTEKGYIRYACDNCTDTYDEELPLADHVYENVTVLEPTCTKNGYTADVCKVCGNEINKVDIPATGHTFELKDKKNATCTEESTEKLVCSTCGITKYTHDDEATGHTFGEWTVDIQPTCTKKGREVRHCTNGNCDATETRDIDKVPHTYEWVRTTDPTVTSTGLDSYVCSVCGDVAETKVVEKLDHEHEFINDEVITSPTCQTTGLGQHTCSICNEVVTYQIPKCGHMFADYSVDYESTCLTKGQKSRKCVWCNLKDGSTIEDLPLAEHTYSEYYTTDKAPTCTEEGVESRHCTVEGCTAHTDDRAIEKVAHDLEVANRIEATCTENGKITYACKNCDYTEDDTTTLAALGHNYDSVVTRPTCTEGGYTTHTCTRCNDTYTDTEVPATGHTPATAVSENVVASTCTDKGHYDEVVYCSTCNAELSRQTIDTDVIEHTPGQATRDNVQDATCTEAGSYDEVVKCTMCGQELSREAKVIDALGHDYKDVVTAPTCTEAGYTTHTCERCGNVVTDTETPATGHTPAATVSENVVAPTCTEAGSHEDVVYCASCNVELSRTPQTDEALGHDYKDVVTAPTCTEAGYTTHTCTRCNNVVKDTEVPATGHNAGEWEVTKPATCSKLGEKVIKCTTCGTVLDTADVELDPNNHTFKENTTNEVDPTCTEKGLRIDTCDGCGATTEVELDALGHDYVAKVTTEATYDAEGVKTYTCTRCNDSYTESIPKLVKEAVQQPATAQSTQTDSQAATTSTQENVQAQNTGSTRNEGSKTEMSARTTADILEKVKNTSNETLEFDADSTKLTKEVLQAAHDNNDTIVLKANKYTWYIVGSNIDNPHDIDLGVNVGTNAISSTKEGKRAINKLVKDKDYIELSLDYDGEFGLKAMLEIDVDEKYNGRYAALYYYNEEGDFENMGYSIAEDGKVSFDFTHASDYVIMFADATEKDDTKTTIANNSTQQAVEQHKTVNMVLIILIIGLVAVGIICTVIALILKKHKN